MLLFSTPSKFPVRIMRTTSIFFPLLTLGLFAVGCSSPKTSQDMCDCLDKSADTYLAQHPNLTKAELESTGNEVMTALLTPCKGISDDIEKRLKDSDPAAYGKAGAEVQLCLTTIAAKMKDKAKADPVGQTDESGAQSQDTQDAAEDAADAAADAKADEAADASPAEGSTTRVNNENWDQLIADYASYMHQAAQLMKKAGAGDLTAAADYPEVYAKAQDVGQRLQAAGNRVTPQQTAKFLKMQTRLMQEIAQVQR